MTVMKTLTAHDAPRLRNILARGLQQSNRRENSSSFEGRQKDVPYWAMLKIQADLQEEYGILIHARRTRDLRRKAKVGQHHFVEQDVKRRDELEYLIQQWQKKPLSKKKKDWFCSKYWPCLKKIKINIMSKKSLSDHCQCVHRLVCPLTRCVTN